MCCSQHQSSRPPENKRERLNALLAHPHVDGPTIALIQIWLFVLNVLASFVQFSRCLKSCFHFLWLGLPKGGACHVRLESNTDMRAVTHARKKTKLPFKSKQRKSIVIFEARRCGRTSIAERYKKSLRDACKRKQSCCNCLVLRQKGDR